MVFFRAPMLTYQTYAALRCSKTTIFATPWRIFVQALTLMRKKQVFSPEVLMPI